MRSYFKRSILAIVSLIYFVTITGCSQNNGKLSMGRYVEERYNAPSINYIQKMTELDDGKIGIIGYLDDMSITSFISEDGGKTWEENNIDLPKKEGKEPVINSANFLGNDKILISYYFINPMSEKVEEVNEEEYFDSIENELSIVDKDGNFTDVEIDLSSYFETEDTYGFNIGEFKINSNGDLFCIVGDNYDKIVQLSSETFEEKNVYDGNEGVDDFFLVGDSLIINSFDSLVEYNTTTGKQKGNLEKLEKETINVETNYYPRFIDTNSNDKLYYYNVLGLYCYDMKSKKIKQIVDGAISSFGDSDMYVMFFIEKDNNEYLAAFNDFNSDKIEIVNYSYDPNIPSVPEQELKVYSLVENDIIRQAIAKYRKSHPDTYVKYEVGLTWGDGVTESDALKTLNTEIMGGNGPDIILLDGLSAESYIEKGLLEDISDVINPCVENDTVFKNIADAYKVDGKIYQFPTKFRFPMLIGDRDVISSVTDLNSFESVIKELAKQTDKRILSEYYSPKSLAYALYYPYGSNWLRDDNTINEDELRNYFTVVKKIYESIAENSQKYMETIDDKYQTDDSEIYVDEAIDEYFEEDFEYEEETYEVEALDKIYEMEYYLNPSIYAENFLIDDSINLEYGAIDGADGYETLITLLANKSNLDYKILSRGDERIFIPSNIIGINSKSNNKEVAKEIIKELLLTDSVDSRWGAGLTVNKEILKKQFEIEKTERDELEFDEATNHYIIGIMGYGNEDGSNKEVIRMLPNEEDVNKLIGEIENLNVAATVNNVLLAEVGKQFESYVLNQITLEEAINAVVDKLDLYLSE